MEMTASSALSAGALSGYVADLMGVSPQEIQPHASLVEAGLDSISMMRIADYFRSCGYSIKFDELIADPTIDAWMRRAVQQNGKQPTVRSDVSSSGSAFELTPVQQAYWFGRQDDQPLGGVGCHLYLELDGNDVDPSQLDLALTKLKARHPMLRARFLDDGLQKIEPDARNMPVTVHDLRKNAGDAIEYLDGLRNKLAHRRLDVADAELLDLQVSLLPGGRTRMHINVDLLVADVLSITIILRDLAMIYLGREAELPPLDLDFERYQTMIRSEREPQREAARQYWSERLSSLPGGPRLPLAIDPSEVTRPHFVRRQFHLDTADVERLHARARSQGLTLACVLATAFGEVLGRWSDGQRFLVNVPLFDRQEIDPSVSHMVADFTSLVLLEVNLEAEMGFAERAKRVQAQLHRDIAHAAYSGVDVLRDLARSDQGTGRAAPVVFACNFGVPFVLPVVATTFGRASWMISQTPQVWLDHQTYPTEDGLLLNWDAVDQLFPSGTLDTSFAAYEQLVRSLVNESWEQPARLPLPEAEAAVRESANATEAPLVKRQLHEAFFERVSEEPEGIALIGHDSALSYRELAGRALRVAGLLRKHGVSEGDVVGIALPKSPEQVIAVLGVVAAGAIYLPISWDQPAARTRRICQRAAARVVLTRSERLIFDGWPEELKVVDLAQAESVAPLSAPVRGSPDQSAYIIFTSGSTGEPKGVEVCHGAAWNTVACIELPVAQNDRRARVNAVARPLPRRLLHEPVFERAETEPERIAVVGADGSATYRELIDRANAVASTLLRTGCKAGEVVAIAMDKGVDQIVAVLGVLQAGAVYLPIDIGQPRARRDIILRAADVSRLLTHSAIENVLEVPASVTHVIAVDRVGQAAKGDWHSPTRTVDDLAYVIFTSGSTGTPKGVMISHLGARNTIDDINESFEVGPRDCVLGLANLGFDLSVFDIFGVLGRGGTLILPDPSRRGDPSHWAERARTCGVTIWNSVPAQLEMLTDYLRGAPSDVPQSLRLAMLSGDWIPVSLPSRIRHFLPGLDVISLGGATEASIWSIFYRIDDVSPDWKSIPYGVPLANQTFHVLDSALRPCPDLVAGELFIGGHGLALGYLGDREKTEERFVRHPVTGERLYRTGDFGRYLSDGNIEFLGRQDLQVKIRGHRIEIAEVEAALASHPHVNGAVVQVQGDNSFERRLIAFVSSISSPERSNELPELSNVADAAARQLTADLDVAKVSELASSLERVSLLSMAAAFNDHGLFVTAEQNVSSQEVLLACKVSSRNERLICRWLRALVAEGILGRDESGRYFQRKAVDQSEISGLWAKIDKLARDVDWGTEVLRYVRSSQENLAGLMRDEVDPLHLLFPEGETAVAEGAYRNNLVSRYMNGLVCAIIQHNASHQNSGTTRLLEAGAGVGGTSMDLIPQLDSYGVDYRFTDFSQYFLNEAERRLASFSWVRFGIFDINIDHLSQGIEPNATDVILCANVLHNSRNVADVLRRLREILAPGGWLIFIEATKDSYQIMSSMEFKEGLTDFEDCRRDLDTTFLTCAQWENYLRDASATTVLRFPGDGHSMSDVGQHVFAAQFKPDRKPISPSELRQHAAELLPEYMVPAEIHVLDALPVTENGKIDRKKLAGFAPQRRDSAASKGAAPKDDLEREIAAVWASVLRLDFVGTDQNFFELGGDSLLVAQVVGRLRERLPMAAALEWDVLLRRLLNEPTVGSLATLLRSAEARGQGDGGLALIEMKRGRGVPTLLFVHDGSGTLAPYRHLLDALGDEHRALGVAIQDPTVFLSKDPTTAITDLAQRYVEQIATNTKPGERLHIVGYCLGGLLATEIARQLDDRKTAIERLSVISSYRVPFMIEDDVLAEYVFARVMQADPFALGYPSDEAGMQRLIANALEQSPGRVAVNALRTAAISMRDEASRAILDLARKSQEERLNAIGRLMRHAGTDLASPERVRAQYNLIKHSLAAVAQHEARSYQGDTVFIRQTGEVQVLPGMHEDMTSYWTQLCAGRLQTVDVPGDHFSCMAAPNVAAVAAALGLEDRGARDGK